MHVWPRQHIRNVCKNFCEAFLPWRIRTPQITTGIKACGACRISFGPQEFAQRLTWETCIFSRASPTCTVYSVHSDNRARLDRSQTPQSWQTTWLALHILKYTVQAKKECIGDITTLVSLKTVLLKGSVTFWSLAPLLLSSLLGGWEFSR
jgi:hypothetical protein